MKNIGIIGSGIVAQTLGSGLLKLGYNVCMGTRNIEKLADWNQKEGGLIQITSFNEAAQKSDILVLAVKGTAAHNALGLINKEHLRGKIIMDTTNPIADMPPENGVLRYFSSLDKSHMEQLQENFPEAKFVKAFNSVGSASMVNPDFSVKPSMFICGNDTDAKVQVAEITNALGWEALDFGPATSARAIEPLCMLWCIPGFSKNEWSHAFKLLRK